MAEPYTIRIFVTEGDPEGFKIIDHLNWTGVGLAFPRHVWPKLSGKPDFMKTGVYVLVGAEEGAVDDLPTLYIGQGDAIGLRIDEHFIKKDFWNWCFAFVSASNALNRAHATWLEHSLIDRARSAGRCHLDNSAFPKEPSLSASEKADTNRFLNEMLRILPLLNVRAFEKPVAVAQPAHTPASASMPTATDARDTAVVPAQEEGFKTVFLGQNCWYEIRIGGGMLPRIKYIAAYQTAPVSAVTYWAPVKSIEPYGDGGKYKLLFSEPAKKLDRPIPFADAPQGSMQGSRYTTREKLLSATKIADLL